MVPGFDEFIPLFKKYNLMVTPDRSDKSPYTVCKWLCLPIIDLGKWNGERLLLKVYSLFSGESGYSVPVWQDLKCRI